jgi:hypothetical protein
LIALPALADQYPLSSTDIRDAYFIGRRNDDVTADFFAPYLKHLSMPETGPFVEEIQLDTPFTQVVTHAATTANYDSPTAVEEFQGKTMTFRVYVEIFLTPTYPEVRPSDPGDYAAAYFDFWKDFKIQLIQDSKVIPSKSIHESPLYPPNDYTGPPPDPVGARIELVYDPEEIDDADTTVRVLTPDGQDIKTPFELGRLR